MKKEASRSRCAINAAVEVFGDRWSLLILRDLIFFCKCQYKEFLDSDEGISTNILADRLVSLEAVGMIEKIENPRPGIRAEYFPSLKALDLIPVLLELVLWSEKYFTISERGKNLIKKIRVDREGLVAEVRSRCRDKRNLKSGE